MAEVGVCIQLGLHNTAEYLYLTEDNWKDIEVDALNRVPHSGVDEWCYYGIDAEGESISMMLRQHVHNPRAIWIQSYIAPGPTQLVKYKLFGGNEPRPSYFAPTISFDKMLSELNIKRIDVLAVDIEGTEYELFEAYGWNIKPRFISVELHNTSHTDTSFITLIESIGYDTVLYTPTNLRNGTYFTREAHFRLRENG